MLVANWQTLSDLLCGLYNPLSLRTFTGSAEPPILDKYTCVHWDTREKSVGFADLMILQADSWSKFQFKFWDSTDERRALTIKVDNNSKFFSLEILLDNEVKLDNTIEKIKSNIQFHGSSNVSTSPSSKYLWYTKGMTVTVLGGISVLIIWQLLTYAWTGKALPLKQKVIEVISASISSGIISTH